MQLIRRRRLRDTISTRMCTDVGMRERGSLWLLPICMKLFLVPGFSYPTGQFKSQTIFISVGKMASRNMPNPQSMLWCFASTQQHKYKFKRQWHKVTNISCSKYLQLLYLIFEIEHMERNKIYSFIQWPNFSTTFNKQWFLSWQICLDILTSSSTWQYLMIFSFSFINNCFFHIILIICFFRTVRRYFHLISKTILWGTN